MTNAAVLSVRSEKLEVTYTMRTCSKIVFVRTQSTVILNNAFQVRGVLYGTGLYYTVLRQKTQRSMIIGGISSYLPISCTLPS